MICDFVYSCQALKCLPKPGGLLDQDAYQVIVMQMVIGAQNEKQERDLKKAERKAK
jgi:hypothetical protein